MKSNLPYTDKTLSIPTAARLSASFSYVSPPVTSEERAATAYAFHVVDGNYFDDFGISVAVEYLSQVFYNKALLHRLRGVIILQIRACPDSTERKPKHHILASVWGDEVLGPVETILGSRDTTQAARGDLEIAALVKQFSFTKRADCASDTSDEHRCDFVTSIVIQAQHYGPLSWRLSDDDITKIKDDWGKNAMEINQVLRIVNGP